MQPRAAGLLEGFGYGEEKFFLVRAADELKVDGESFRGAAEGKRQGRKTGKIQPLAEAHGVAIIVRIAGAVVAGAMWEGGCGGDRREKNRNIVQLPKQIGTDGVALGA